MKFLNMLSDRNVIILMCITMVCILYYIWNRVTGIISNDLKSDIIKEHQESQETKKQVLQTKEIEIVDPFTLFLIELFSRSEFEGYNIIQVTDYYLENYKKIVSESGVEVNHDKEPLKMTILYFKQKRKRQEKS